MQLRRNGNADALRHVYCHTDIRQRGEADRTSRLVGYLGWWLDAQPANLTIRDVIGRRMTS
jgi:hypothetical protein